MALRGTTWFYGQCRRLENSGSPLAPLAAQAIDLGVGGIHGTRGHMNHAIGAAQRFFQQYPQHRQAVAVSAPDRPFSLATSNLLHDWLTLIGSSAGPFGTEYNWETLKGYLTPKYGGIRTGGGGGDNELEIAIRLVSEM